MFNQLIHRSKRSLHPMEDVTEFEQRPAHFSRQFVMLMISVQTFENEVAPFPHSARDLERKLRLFRDYYNHGGGHASLSGVTPIGSTDRNVIALDDYQWRSHCRELYQCLRLHDAQFATHTHTHECRRALRCRRQPRGRRIG